MNSNMILSAVAVVVLLQIIPAQGCPLNACRPPINACSYGAPINLPLQLPSTIPLGQICTCNQIALKPTFLPPCHRSCNPCNAPSVNPMLLKQLLPLLTSMSC